MVMHRQAQQKSELAEWLMVAGGLTAIAVAFMIGSRDDDADFARRRERRRKREEARRRRRNE
jgi:hypothetical protein